MTLLTECAEAMARSASLSPHGRKHFSACDAQLLHTKKMYTKVF